MKLGFGSTQKRCILAIFFKTLYATEVYYKGVPDRLLGNGLDLLGYEL